MNRNVVTIAVVFLLTSISIGSWVYIYRVVENKTVVSPKKMISAAFLNDHIAPAAGGGLGSRSDDNQRAPIKQAPVVRAPVSQLSGDIQTPQAVGQAVTQTPIVATPSAEPAAEAAVKKSKPTDKVEMTTEEMMQIHDEVKKSIEEDYKDKLSFPLTEEKMIAFSQASLKVKKINNKWDVQIAGAETKEMAIEYNNFSIEENTKSLANIPGLTLDQYNEMTQLTSVDASFNRAYQVYKELIEENIVKPVTGAAAVTVPQVSTTPAGTVRQQPVTTSKPQAATPAPAVPAKQAAPVSSATPSNSGTLVIPQGSTTPQYSRSAFH